ncbi:MAG TPA: hypothetical protein VK157_02350, partial [Phycisphaerales bacterium]|nr:hypothetical protein [Phycisphaerales bacterium]
MIKRVHTAGMGRVLANAGWMSVGLFSLAGCSSTPDTPARNVPMVSGASVRPAPAADMSKPVALAGR